MNEERRRILDLLSQGKISVEEAEQLLATTNAPATAAVATASGEAPRFLRIILENGPQAERINVRVPMQLLRAGVRLAALIPKGMQGPINSALKEQGLEIDLNALNPSDLESLVDHLAQLTVDLDNPNERIKVFCE